VGKHYVTQEYLRGFAVHGDANSVWMFDKVHRRWSCAAIDKVAQERDYFSPEVESQLADQVESPGHRVLKRLRAPQHLEAGDRDALALYIAVMMKRVPRARRKAYELLPSVLEATVANLRGELDGALASTAPDRLATLLADLDRAVEKAREEPPPGVVEQIRTPTVSKQMFEAIERMVWRMVVRPLNTSPFITSDNPAFYFESYGVGTPNAELTFPISPALALLGSHQGVARSTVVMTTTRDIAKEINRRVASGAERFVFSSVRARWIETLATRRNPFLSRIRW
jgi:hypothetical protein